jgi:sigma-B regulation protein RsbU (phosphoserine phosphatase)
LELLGANLWAPLKIRDEFLGVISLGSFRIQDNLEDLNRELLPVLANQISVAIAYSRLVDKTRAEQFRLFMLSDTATQICKSLDTEAVQEEVVTHAITLLDASAGGLLLINPVTQRLEMKSLFALEPEANTQLENLSIPLQTDQESSSALMPIAQVANPEGETLISNIQEEGLLGRRNLMAVPMRGREETLGVLIVADKEGRGGTTLDFTDEDRVLLEAFANQAGVAIENAQLYQEALEGRQLQAEMDEAAKIQQSLIPEALPEISGYEATGLYFPRGGVGGDYYDCLPDVDDTWGLAIADVSGKGMQAALLMATLRAGLHSEVTRKEDLPSMAEALNSLLYASSTSGKFATFFYAQLHPETDQITSINAGHNYPLVIRSEGGCDELEKGGVMLGMFPNDVLSEISEFEQETIQLGSGDVVLFYTDGVTETINTDGDLYEEERLEAVAQRVKGESADQICQAIYDDVIAFQGEAEQFDDLTLMVLKKI